VTVINSNDKHVLGSNKCLYLLIIHYNPILYILLNVVLSISFKIVNEQCWNIIFILTLKKRSKRNQSFLSVGFEVFIQLLELFLQGLYSI